MFKKVIKKLEDLRHKRMSSARYLILGLVAIISLALIYIVTVPGEQEAAHYPVSYNRAGVGVNEATKLVILQWMKEHSEMPEQVLSKIYSAAMNNVNADLVLAICLVESNFNPHVESERGAIGLMGIMPDVWLEELKTHGIVREQDDLYTISSNINSGIYVLGRYLARTNNLREALSRYAGGDPAYAARVLRMLGEISRVRRSEDQPRLAALRTSA
ncbi:MAG: lytic transglycosylase domain-containing protein [Nitrospiraceae bacterium]|nr:lytic transglycosylase domain-containing protein [Nitrospiraceae bacterium]